MYKYSGIVLSDLECIKFFLDEVVKDMNSYVSNEETMFDIRLILSELVLNGAIHGNKMTKDKEIRLDIDLEENSLKISVQDQGDGIDCCLDSYNPNEMKCCGRGLVIVNKLSDEMLIEKNKIMVIKKII